MPRRTRPGYRTKSGAVKLQVLLTPAEYRALLRLAKEQAASVSLVARSILAHKFGYPSGVPAIAGKYQPRNFAR